VHALQTATPAGGGAPDDLVRRAVPRHRQGDQRDQPPRSRRDDQAYVSTEVYHVIRVHQDFQGKHYYAFRPGPRRPAPVPDEPCLAAAQFADEWDQRAFDPDGETYPLEHFEPLVRTITAAPRSGKLIQSA
jgi:predicted HD phosphohydrolase